MNTRVTAISFHSLQACLLASVVGGTWVLATGLWAQRPEMPAIPDFTQGAKPDESHDWTLGPTGARGRIFSRNGHTADARQILVAVVAEGSPADGVLEPGDVILGIGETPFAADARIEFARAITAAEEEQRGGRLDLFRWRSGAQQVVQVHLPVVGSYSATAPYDCPKSARIFDQACRAIAARGLRQVSIPNDLNALALLASGDHQYHPMLAEYAQKVAQFRADGFATWYYGYANMFLAEYYLATGDSAVLAGVRRLALEAARGQSAVGTWGHKFAMPNGNLNGYGCMNQPGISLTISLVLAREAGVREPELDAAIEKSARFLRWYVDKGAIPYGDHQPWPGHEDNGKCSSAAVLFDLLGDAEAAKYFSRMAAAAYDEREQGHTGNYFNVLWALPGVMRCGPAATGAYFREHAWYYDLARGWDGSVAYQGSPVGQEEHGKYTDWDCTGSFLLAFAASRRSLYLTGKRPFAVPPLQEAETRETIAAGRDYFAVDGNRGYDARTTDQLLKGLASWSPAVRKRSAAALGRRAANLDASVVETLCEMLESDDRLTRYGACEALRGLGPQTDSAGPQLRALLLESDPWLQSLAASAIPALGQEQRQASVPDLLAMTNRKNPADPRGMAQRAAAAALFAPYPGTRGPRSILSDSLEGVDRELLYPAIQSLLENEDPVARGAAARIYDKLTDQDIVVLLPSIVAAIEQMAPSNEMFADGVRLAGLDLLSRLRIREGMALCVAVIEPDRWGAGKRLPQCLEYLARYGAHATAVAPQLNAIRQTIAENVRGASRDEQVKLIDECLAAIQSDTPAAALIDLEKYSPAGNPQQPE